MDIKKLQEAGRSEKAQRETLLAALVKIAGMVGAPLPMSSRGSSPAILPRLGSGMPLCVRVCACVCVCVRARVRACVCACACIIECESSSRRRILLLVRLLTAPQDALALGEGAEAHS